LQIALAEESSFPSSVSLHRGSPFTYITWEMNNSPIGGRSSETQTHPTDMITIIIIFCISHLMLF
jgi:hypothetical protein